MDATYENAKDDALEPTRIPNRPMEYFKRLYFDTVCYHRAALMCAYETVGADRLVFGTDYPFKSLGNMSEHLDLLKSLRIPREEKEKILGGNLTRLLRS